MANVRIEQRNAHLATPVKVETVTTRDGEVTKATVIAISNSRKGSGDNREDEPTAIQWTLWGKLAENAGQYLGKGSHVNVTGRLRNNHYLDAKGNTVFGFSFTVEEIDYLDSRAESEARRARQEEQAPEPPPPEAADAKAQTRSRKASKATPVDDDVPF